MERLYKVKIGNALFSMIVVINIVALSEAWGRVDYNDDCESPLTDTGTGTALTSEMREWKMCNTERGLYCVPGLGRCGCYIPHSIYRMGKCRAKVNNACLSFDNVRIDCVENAFCNNSGISWKCQCWRGYLSNAENTSCFPASEATREWRDYQKCRNTNSWWSSSYYSSNPYWCNHSSCNHPPNFIYLAAILTFILIAFCPNYL